MTAGSRTPSHRLALWMGTIFLFCLVYFLPWGADSEQDVRLDMTLALVNHGTLAIDQYRWNTRDIDYSRGHYYSIESAGQSLLAVPVALAYRDTVRLLEGRTAAAEIGANTDSGRFSFYVLQYLVSMATVVPAAVLFLLLFFWLSGEFSTSLTNRVVLTLTLGLGTMVFPYAQVFYSHLPSAALLLAGFTLLYLLANPGRSRGPRLTRLLARPRLGMFLAGLLMGLACVFEYPSAFVVGPLLLYAALRLPRWYLVHLVAGLLPGLLAILGYNFAVYHNPFVTGYSGHSLAYRGQYGHGLIAGFGWPPRFQAAWGLSFSPYRGLFFLSPFLLLAFPGVAIWWLRQPVEAAFCLLTSALFIGIICMYPVWYGGSAVGPRYLFPVLAFLALPVIFVLDAVRTSKWRAVVWASLLLSFANVWVQTVGSARGYPSEHIADPLFSYSLPSLLHNHVVLSFGSALLGAFAGPRSTATLLPLLFLCAAWTVRVFAADLTRGRDHPTEIGQEPSRLFRAESTAIPEAPDDS